MNMACSELFDQAGFFFSGCGHVRKSHQAAAILVLEKIWLGAYLEQITV
jgi:hypothetical protein